MKKQIIMISGGGTGGHVAPALSVTKKIHDLDPEAELVYVIDRGNPNEHLITESQIPIKIRHIFAGKYRRFHTQSFLAKLFSVKNNLLNLRDALYTVLGFFQSLWLILKYRPVVVFSKGVYASVPICLSAAIFRVPIVTHDSDSVPGLANRISGRFATKNAVGVDGANYPYKQSKIVFTGVPVGEEYLKLATVPPEISKKNLELPANCQLIFIGGSTQGALAIDDAVEKIVPELLKKFPKLYIIHSFGRLNEDSLQTRYQDLPPQLKERLILKTFLPDLYNYAAAADIVITRAGATALAGFGTLGKACIVIPAAHLTGGHQLENSKALAKEKAVIVVDEDRAGDELQNRIEYLLQHEDQREKLGKTFQSITPKDAAEKLAETVLSVKK